MEAKLNDSSESRFLRLPEVKRRVGLGKTKIYELVKRGEFPPAVKIGRASVWVEDRVVAWQQEKIDA